MSGPTRDSLERFAELCATLDHGSSANRASVLATAGLDAAAWQGLGEHWTAQLQQQPPDAAAEMGARFRAAYSATREALARSETPPFPGSDTQLRRDAATSAPTSVPTAATDTRATLPVGMSAPNLDATVVGPVCALRPALPFAPSVRPQRDARDPLDVTVDAPLHSPSRPVLPFVPVPPPGKRLIRFDPHTGLPLPVPLLEDDPGNASTTP
jgi:hypothetical protein